METTNPETKEAQATEEAGAATKTPAKDAPPAQTQKAAEGPANLRLILDVPLEISVELGRSRILVKELLKLGQGSIVELDKMMDEPMEILVNQKKIARGEVVVSNDRFGIRLTDILDPMERLEKLQ